MSETYPKGAVEQLTNHQQQADMDGVFVKVSRQAVEEVLAYVKSTRAPTEAQPIDTSIHPNRSPTHRCKVCGAFWIEWAESWSLCSKQCGPCCDNVAMGDQIEPLIISDVFERKDTRAPTEAERLLREARDEFHDGDGVPLKSARQIISKIDTYLGNQND